MSYDYGGDYNLDKAGSMGSMGAERGDFPMPNVANIPLSTAIAGGAVIGSLLDTLVAKGVLNRDDVQSILTNAQSSLVSATDSDIIMAARIVSGWFQKFTDR